MDTLEGRRLEIANDRRHWEGTLPNVSLDVPDETEFRPWFEVPFEEHCDGALLIPGLWFEVVGTERLEGIPWSGSGEHPRAHDEYWLPDFWDEVNEVEMLVDADLGVIRRLGTRGSTYEWVQEPTDVELDPEVPADLFEFTGT